MPSSYLQKTGVGLLGALNLKTLGRQPNAFNDMVQPAFEVEEYYLLDLQSFANATAAAVSAVNSKATMTVPTSEIWRVISVGGAASAFSGAVAFPVSFAVEAILPGAATGVELGTAIAPSINAANDTVRVVQQRPPFFLAAGSGLQMVLGTALGAVTVDLAVRAIIQRIPL